MQDIDTLYQQISKLRKLPSIRLDGQDVGSQAPEYYVPDALIGNACDEITKAGVHILISDFGEAFLSNQDSRENSQDPSYKPRELHLPTPLLPPGYIFGEQPMTSAIDIWSLGLTLFDLLGCRRLFEAFIADEDDVVAEMISARGPLPQRWWNQWKNRSIFFH